MKKLSYLLLLLIGLCFGGCNPSETVSYGYIEITEEGASTFVLKGYEDVSQGFSVLEADGCDSPFYIKDRQFIGSAYTFLEGKSGKLSDMGDIPGDEGWQATVAVVAGKNYWARCIAPTKYVFLKLRVAYIDGNNVGLEYLNAGTKDHNLNANINSNIRFQSEYPSVCNFEIPAIQDADYIYREHYVDYKDQHVMNLAIEWDVKLRHSHWIAFSFDKTTAADNVKRTDTWAWDPAYDFATMGGVEEADHKSDGYDKGHLCASEDRVYCTEANNQTFYYTNISPQIASFNQKYWMYLEQQVQKWGRSTREGTYDKVYVVKGGTLNKLLTNFTGTMKGGDGKYPETDAEGFTIHGLAVPAYYYMAILTEKDDTYHAIAFLVPHSELLPQKPTADDFQVYAVSIDKLEQETGIDFFCNLPDVIEDEVEKAYNKADWAW